jgi:hypothetical protein
MKRRYSFASVIAKACSLVPQIPLRLRLSGRVGAEDVDGGISERRPPSSGVVLGERARGRAGSGAEAGTSPDVAAVGAEKGTRSAVSEPTGRVGRPKGACPTEKGDGRVRGGNVDAAPCWLVHSRQQLKEE